MELAALAGMSAFAVASLLVGVRLVLLSRRTGLLPERMIGISLLLAGGLGSIFFVASGFAGGARWLVATLAIGLVNCGVAALGVFTWRVFRPTLFGATLVASCGMLLLMSMIVDRAAGHYLGMGRSSFSVASDYGGRLILYAWATAESLRQWILARRRVRLGLTDPLVANRFLLWSVATTAALGIWLHALAQEVAHRADTTESYLVASVLGGACALAIWLAFFPPRAYRARFGAPSASAP
jgi:hypothetical protein